MATISGCRWTADRSNGRRGPAASAGVPDALATEPNVFIYDNYPGGIGFSEPLFEMHDALLAGHPRPDRRLSVRVRLSVVRRSGGEYRAARESRSRSRILDLLLDGKAA